MGGKLCWRQDILGRKGNGKHVVLEGRYLGREGEGEASCVGGKMFKEGRGMGGKLR